jgi:hypothetical protein
VYGVHKLIGFSGASGDQVLVLTDDKKVGLVSLSTGEIEPSSNSAKIADYSTLLRHMLDGDRSYDDGFLLSVEQNDASSSCQVFLSKPNDTEPVNVSKCRRMDCGQPSLSRDRRQVVFVGQPIK